MRKIWVPVALAISMAFALALPATAAPAFVKQDGSAFDSVRNPNGCKIKTYPPHPTEEHKNEVHVTCTARSGATGGATLYYRMKHPRFGSDVKFIAAIENWGHGKPDAARVRVWALSPTVGGVWVPFGVYTHVRWVRWLPA